jgi:hypothetical protein
MARKVNGVKTPFYLEKYGILNPVEHYTDVLKLWSFRRL